MGRSYLRPGLPEEPSGIPDVRRYFLTTQRWYCWNKLAIGDSLIWGLEFPELDPRCLSEWRESLTDRVLRQLGDAVEL